MYVFFFGPACILLTTHVSAVARAGDMMSHYMMMWSNSVTLALYTPGKMCFIRVSLFVVPTEDVKLSSLVVTWLMTRLRWVIWTKAALVVSGLRRPAVDLTRHSHQRGDQPRCTELCRLHSAAVDITVSLLSHSSSWKVPLISALSQTMALAAKPYADISECYFCLHFPSFMFAGTHSACWQLASIHTQQFLSKLACRGAT